MRQRTRTGWLADLALGARMVFAGGRNGLARTLMAAVGVGLGVALLLGGTSISTMLGARDDRTAARDDQFFGVPEPAPGDRTLLVANVDTEYREQAIRGRMLQPEGTRAPVPPGLTALPRPGELFVSPALGRLLAAGEGALLKPRLAQPVAGTIGAEGLSGPGEYAFYLGTDQLQPGVTGVRIDHFGSDSAGEGLDPVLLLLVLIILVVLLLPIAVFIAAAARFGGENRDRRLAALRLVGADGVMTRRIAAGEALLGAVLGLAFGGVFFLIGRQLVEGITLREISVYAGDVRPSPALAALIALVVPGTAIVVAQLALRRVVIEPLGVVRRSAGRRRRLWWRLTLPIGGLALLLPLLDGIDQTGGAFNEAQVVTGVVLLLVGVAALLPWLVEAAVRRLHGGPVSWQLAIRRLQLDSETSARLVSGVAVAVAGGIALQMLFAGIQHNYVLSSGHDVDRAQVVVSGNGVVNGADVGPLREQLRAVPGVRQVFGTLDTNVAAVGTPREQDGYRPANPLRIGDCQALRELATLDSCTDGDVFALADDREASSSLPPLPSAGQRMELGDRAGTGWTVPATMRPAEPRPDPIGREVTGILATPGAVEPGALAGLDAFIYVAVDRSRPETIELIRNVVTPLGPGMAVQTLDATYRVDRFAEIRRGLFIGVLATLLLLGASLLVGSLEQLRERRRVLAVLVAFGTRRSTLSWSVLWQTAVPVLLGLALALVIGTALGATLLVMVGEPLRLDWSGIAGMSGIAGAVVLLVTAFSLPALWRMLRPNGLRTE
ncbi:ABC transporter permease [Plantactinospora soyae]|uniref:Tetrahydromethanopterin S-methyltransferase subunit F n=1 Tax=Plantactinospora soyae TaxID=1544732 RepID=A0A927QY76_9ACTN|nr:FtsX-like permease family protein [Plantactinospora soyae]MBE1488910.1 tetrahydromethanopterin S-methyltransferase subunit F [Plantactinospora soyae]